MAYYPIFLELKGRPCLVIGGGEVAAQKAKALIRCGAKVRLVSPRLSNEARRLVQARKIRWVPKDFDPRQIDGVELIVAATDDPQVNKLAYRQARRRGIWINVVDRPRLCSFIVPSVVRRGKLVLAISTGGVSPALAKWIRKDLTSRYGLEFARLLKTMREVRPKVLKNVSGVSRRKRLLERALTAYRKVIQEGISR